MPTSPAQPDASPALAAAVREHREGLWIASEQLPAAALAASRWRPQAVRLGEVHYRAPARREAFLAGRNLAAAALQALGIDAPVGRAANGSPLWPEGAVGSIAHDAEWAVAAVARAAQWAAVGIDVEPDLPLPADAASIVLLPADLAALQAAFGAQATAHSRLVFSAKECVHKALHPWRGAWLEFDEVTIEWLAQRPDGGSWQLRPVSAAAEEACAGVEASGEWWRVGGALFSLLSIRA